MKTLGEFQYIDAKTVEQAIEALSKAEGKGNIVAGGTDLVGTMRFRILRDYPEVIVNLKNIEPSLDYIKEEGGVLKVGALTRLEDIAASDTVKAGWQALSQAAHRTASPHIRESGTIGGNICQLNRCWYFRKEQNRFDCIRKGGNMCYALIGDNRYHSIFGAVKGCIAVNPSDVAPALVVLNAVIKTNKREIEAAAFWDVAIPGSTVLAVDEFVTEIQLPEFTGKSAFNKFAKRSSIDFPIVNCAVAIQDGEARICLNAVAPKPVRATAAETFIKGKTVNEENAAAAGDEAVKGAIGLGKNNWKIQVARTMVKRTILVCA